MKGLYIATHTVAKDYNLINNSQIKLIVNCAASKCKNWFLNDFSYKWYFISDLMMENLPNLKKNHQENQTEPMTINIESLVYSLTENLSKFISSGSNVLLHCYGYDP